MSKISNIFGPTSLEHVEEPKPAKFLCACGTHP